MKPEQYFLRYAFPCAHILLEQNKITKEQYIEMKKAFYENAIVPREKLENTFKAAFRRLKAIKEDYWNVDALRHYFVSYHNKCIDENEGDYAKFSEEFKEDCKVKKYKILKKKGVIFIIDKNGTKTQVEGKMLPDAKEGEYIYVHLGVAVEIA